MRILVIFFFAVLGKIACEPVSEECKTDSTASPSRRLKDHLFCDYDASTRPGNVRTSTIVDVEMLPQYVEFTERDNILYFHTWLSITWKDEYLSWEPAKWDDVKNIHVWSYEVWTPELSVFNSGDTSENDAGMMIGDCWVTFNGTVKCITPTKYSSHCPTDYSDWPYDKHNCTLQFGAWLFYREEILLKFSTDSVLMHNFMPNKQWDVHIENGIPEYFSSFSDEGQTSVYVTIVLQRHAFRLAIVYILPAFVLMVLTLIVFWLDAQSVERILVACVNFICHLLGMFDIHWYAPVSGSETTPKILVFYQVSVGLAACALLLTCLLRRLRETNVPAPYWLSSGTSFLLNSPLGILFRIHLTERKKEAPILEENENNGQISDKPRDRTWLELSMIIEWLSFVIAFLVYTIMLTIVLPPGEPKKRPRNFWI